MLIDTHAHIHFQEYQDDLDIVFENAKSNKLEAIITVGSDDENSKGALEFCAEQKDRNINLFASAGLHPHNTQNAKVKLSEIKDLTDDVKHSDKLVAIGECGLDYFKNYSSKQSQYKALEFQIELAITKGLPIIFHVRDAWDDFFAVTKNYKEIRGVIHSFTGTAKEVEIASERGLYFGLNGIMTFTKSQDQIEACRLIAEDKLLFETDCPFLTPEPKRGMRNEPANLIYIAQFIAGVRSQTLQQLSKITTTNAKMLFGLK